MSIFTLAEAKLHLRVDGSDENAAIQIFINAAESSAANYLNRALYVDETAKGTDVDGLVMNDEVRAAVLLHIGTLFANRESVSTYPVHEVPHGMRYLLAPYRMEMGL